MPEAPEQREQLEKRAEIYRALIRQENDITNHRTSWMLVTQGILLAALATLLKDERFLLSMVLSVVGFLTAMSVGKVLRNSEESRNYMKDDWEKLLGKHGYKPFEDFPPLDGGRHPRQAIEPKYFPWRYLPKLFRWTWLIVGAYVVYAWLVDAGLVIDLERALLRCLNPQ